MKLKKIVIWLVVSMLVFPMISNAGETIDLTKMTSQELRELIDRAYIELYEKLDYKSFTVQEGEYRIGVDIPSGAFRVSRADGVEHALFGVNDKDGAPLGYGFMAEGNLTEQNNGIARFVLPEGHKLIVFGAITFHVLTEGVTFNK